MKCSNCEEKIDPKFKHALSENICPACGKNLLSGELYKFKIEVLHVLSKEDLDNEEMANEIVDIVKRKTQTPEKPKTEKKSTISSRSERKSRMEYEVDKALESGKKELDAVGDLSQNSQVDDAVEEEVSYNPDDPDDPNNPENKEFLEGVVWAGSTQDEKELERKKQLAKGKKYVPKPIGRL